MIGYILLSIIILTLSYIVFNLTRKVERLETWVEDYAQRIQDTQETLKEIDSKGDFEADDEVGVIFTSIKEAVDELNEITEEEI
jgi:putative heme iron utilization protein|tara:strand:- start:287 stop:538 length:252 start_codon:yes stop_codon:yes gene_type:complete